MKVLVALNAPYPIGYVTTKRVHNICKGLIEDGVNVEVLILSPTEKPNNIQNTLPRGTFENVHYRYIGNRNVRATTFLLRRRDDLWCHLLTFFCVLFNLTKSDITIVIGPSFDFRLLLPIAAKFTRTIMILEINEYPFVTQTSSLVALIKRSILLRCFVPLYDGFIVISETLSKLINTYKAKNATVIKVPILCNPISIATEKGSSLNHPYIMHAGSLLEDKDGILGMLEAFAIARKQISFPIKFLLTGHIEMSPHHERITGLIAKHDLEQDVVFTGYLSEAELSRHLRHCTLAIINKYDTLQNRYNFATKLADYLSFGIPVITTTVGESNYYLLDGINAYIVPPNCPRLIADKILLAFADVQQREKIASGAKHLAATEFDYRYQGKRMASYLRSIEAAKLRSIVA